MSVKKIVIIALAIVALIAVAAIVKYLYDMKYCCGTPIIIKGSTRARQQVVIHLGGEFSTPESDKLKVNGGFENVRVLDTKAGCFFYDFSTLFCGSGEIKLTTTALTPVSGVNVNDNPWFSGIDIIFDKTNFNDFDPMTLDYKSKTPLKVTSLSIKKGSSTCPKCKDSSGNDCPETWAEADLEDLEVWIDSGQKCPSP